MNRSTMLLMLLLGLVLPGCGMQRHAAESAFVKVEAAYGRMRDRLEVIDPDQTRSIDKAMAAAKEAVDKGDAKEALRMTTELEVLLRETSDRLPTMQAELESAWKNLSASLPGTLAKLRRELRGVQRPPGGKHQVAFDAARGTLGELVDQWEQAQTAMKDGRLAEAVTKAEDVRSRALGLVSVMRGGS